MRHLGGSLKQDPIWAGLRALYSVSQGPGCPTVKGGQGHQGTYLPPGCCAKSAAKSPRVVPGLMCHLPRNRILSRRWSATSPPALAPWAPAACQGGAARGGEPAGGKVPAQSTLLRGSLRPLQRRRVPALRGGASSGPGAPRGSRSRRGPEALELQSSSPQRGTGHWPGLRSQELGSGWALRGQEGELGGQAGWRALCVPSQLRVTALGLAPCSSFPNEPPAAGRRLK